MEIKRCSFCGEEKPFDAFYKDTSKKDGCSSFCRKCRKESSRSHYAENKDITKERQKLYRVEHQDQIRDQKRQWRDANLDHVRKKSREWGRDNKDRRNETFRRWSEANREHLREYDKEWRDLNREHYTEYQREYRIQNPHIILNGQNRRRARMEGFSDITKQEWQNLMVKYGWRCFYCDSTLTSKTRTIDHLIPVSKGGRHHIMNLITCCRNCNTSKNSIIYPVWKGIRILDKDKAEYLVSRIVAEIQACHINVPGDIGLDQLFQYIGGIFKTQVG